MNVGILGLGLIGGSLARAYAAAGHTVYTEDIDENMLSFAMISGTVQNKLDAATIPSCDFILLATYPKGCVEWLENNASLVSKDALVMDCCGIKTEVCTRCFPLAAKYGFTFVGGHPMAGTQFSGYKYSSADMFKGASMVIVPPVYDDILLLERVKEMLAPCEFGKFSVTTADEHDQMIAFTSQMPHIISNGFVQSDTALKHSGFTGGSYKDLTRVAWLNAPMWAELFLDNKKNVLSELDRFIDTLTAYRDAIKDDDAEKLTALLEEGKRRKAELDS